MHGGLRLSTWSPVRSTGMMLGIGCQPCEYLLNGQLETFLLIPSDHTLSFTKPRLEPYLQLVPTTMETVSLFLSARTTLEVYGAASRIFAAFALISMPLCLLVGSLSATLLVSVETDLRVQMHLLAASLALPTRCESTAISAGW